MNTPKKQSHVVWNCTYHVVIVPKYRKKVLYEDTRQRVGEIIRELASYKEVEVVEGNACPDHIHMVLRIPPKHSVSAMMGYLKGKSAIRIHLEKGRRKPLTQKAFWSRGFFVSTVGIDEEMIKKYVKEQWKHDKYIDGPQLDLYWN